MSDEKSWADTEFFNKHLRGAIDWVCEETAGYVVGQMEAHARQRTVHSPLEAAFTAWWVAMRVAGQINGIYLQPQVEVKAPKKNYRLDFALVPAPHDEFDALAKAGKWPKIAVELDGHDFHERTKEQATARNERDRVLQSIGWTVLHYSGSEFNANPKRVVWETYLAGVAAFYDAMRRMEV